MFQNFGFNKFWGSAKKFGVQKIICPKKFRAQKNFKAKDILFWKKIGVWKFFWKHLGSNCLENILSSICLKNFGFNFQKNWALKVFWVWNNLGLKNAGSTKKIWPEINYGPKKFWVKKMFEKYFGSKKILGSKKMLDPIKLWVQKIWDPKKFLDPRK